MNRVLAVLFAAAELEKLGTYTLKLFFAQPLPEYYEKWHEFNRVLARMFDRLALGDIDFYLHKFALIDDETHKKLSRFIEIRNEIVHRPSLELPDDVKNRVDAALRDAIDLLETLQKAGSL